MESVRTIVLDLQRKSIVTFGLAKITGIVIWHQDFLSKEDSWPPGPGECQLTSDNPIFSFNENWNKDYRHGELPTVYMTQSNEREKTGEQSNDSAQANQVIDTNNNENSTRQERSDEN